MADLRKPADLAREARELLAPVAPKRALPPAYPGRMMGMGKQPIPPAKPDRVPLAVKSAPEATRVDGVLQPAPESAPMPPSAPQAPPARSFSPPPTERAVDPESVRIAQAQAKAGAAEQDRIAAEQRKALKPGVFDLLAGWAGTKRGKAAIALAGTLAAGGTWAQVRETVLVALGVESSAAAQAREDRISKRIADVDTKATSAAITARENETRLDQAKTELGKQANELIDLKRNATIVVKPSN